ncbi:hypothetical protein J4E91_001655 [Alternaria rosae]|nr:hypothetical protein J4E91_001655 [Alternaria rosae]
MKVFVPTCFAALACGALAADDGPAKRYNHGFVGVGITALQPACAFGCRDSISGATLNCTTVEEMPGIEGMDMGMGEAMVITEPECYATDDVFLQTLAWCLKIRCNDIPVWELEKYWKEFVPGAFALQPDPKFTYQQALEKIEGTPTAVYNQTGKLNQTSTVAQELWYPAFNTNVIFGHQERQQVTYGLVLLLSGVIIPIAFSLLRFFPFPASLRSKFFAMVIDAPLFGRYQTKLSRFGVDATLTRGQSLFIFYLIVLNTVLSAVNYEYANPNTWYPGDRWRWMVMLVSNRLGVLSFANIPLVFLYAGRNNFLLWLTDWSHSTFILLHQWIAGISTLQAILHSIIYLRAYVNAGTHATEAVKPYWYWGIVGTLGMAVLLPTSIGLIRRKAYEMFLAWHIIISILVVVGCYWHVVFEFQHAWGYETWIIIAMGVWAFDRVARWLRIARHGLHTAEVTILDDEYVRITVPGVATSGYAYLYFPTLTWRIWENHPFSVASTILSSESPGQYGNTSFRDVEKHLDVPVVLAEDSSDNQGKGSSLHQPARAGITFYIRTKTGVTSALRKHITLPILLEAGYSSHSASSLSASPTLIVLAGGVGITAVLPYICSHPGHTKLYWGCRTQGLVDDVMRSGALLHVEKEIIVGGRMAIRDVLHEEVSKAGGGEVAILVSGPESMSTEARDTVRSIVVGQKKVKVNLYVENFSW